MFYIVWIVTAFVAVAAGCYVAHVVDRHEKDEK